MGVMEVSNKVLTSSSGMSFVKKEGDCPTQGAQNPQRGNTSLVSRLTPKNRASGGGTKGGKTRKVIFGFYRLKPRLTISEDKYMEYVEKQLSDSSNWE